MVLGTLVLEGLLRLFPAAAVSPSLLHELRWRASHPRPSFTTGVSFEAFSPELGWEPKPNVRTPGLTSNSRGLRGEREYAREPPLGVYRVLCVGDSLVFGDGLTDEQTMPAQLEMDLNDAATPQWEVLNLAARGYGTDQQWLRLERLGFQYTPDIVVLGFFEEDVWRNALSFREYAKPYFELVNGALVLRNVPVPPPEAVLSRRLELPRVYLVSFVRWLPERLVGPGFLLFDLSGTQMGRVTLAILDAMREAVMEHGAEFLLLIIPRGALRWSTGIERMLRRWAERTGAPVLDLHEVYLRLPATERRALYHGHAEPYHGHWTAEGARVTARLLATELRRRFAGGTHHRG